MSFNDSVAFTKIIFLILPVSYFQWSIPTSKFVLNRVQILRSRWEIFNSNNTVPNRIRIHPIIRSFSVYYLEEIENSNFQLTLLPKEKDKEVIIAKNLLLSTSLISVVLELIGLPGSFRPVYCFCNFICPAKSLFLQELFSSSGSIKLIENSSTSWELTKRGIIETLISSDSSSYIRRGRIDFFKKLRAISVNWDWLRDSKPRLTSNQFLKYLLFIFNLLIGWYGRMSSWLTISLGLIKTIEFQLNEYSQGS